VIRDPTVRRQAMRYVMVGVLGYAVQVGSFALLRHGFGLSALLAGLLAGIIALVHNFLWSRYWTFGAAAGPMGRQAASFSMISIVLFAAQLAVLKLLLELGFPDVVAEALSVVAVVPVNFLAQRRFTFGIDGATCDTGGAS
jgi:putative flippase GtrA